MSIVSMKHLQMIVPRASVRPLLRKLTKAGCLEVERNDSWMSDPELSNLLKKGENANINSKKLNEVSLALDNLEKYAGVKKGLLTPRQEVFEEQVAVQPPCRNILEYASRINTAAKNLAATGSESARIEAKKISLLPWANCDIPLDYKADGDFRLHFATLPSIHDFDKIKAETEADGVGAYMELVSSDKDLHYFTLVTFRSDDEAVLEALKEQGYSEVYFKTTFGTAANAIKKCETKLDEIEKKRVALTDQLKAHGSDFEILGRAYDFYAAQAKWDEVEASLPCTGRVSMLTGWVPEECMDEVAKIAEECDAAFEFEDPKEGDDVPTALKNGRFVTPFGQVTSLYGMPTYDSIIDPNPVVAIFYFIFFGLMFSDAAYGLILFFGCYFFLKKARPDGNMKKFVTMFMYCGISTFIWGALFGSWFGDFVTVFCGRLGIDFTMPAIMNPLNDPIPMLIMSLVFGVIHLYTGMVLNITRQAKRGQWKDILFDEVTWMVCIPCLVLAVMGQKWAVYVAAAMLVIVLVTAGRDKTGLGRVTGGLGALYNGATGNLSDILSYSRLMALAMSTGVIAQVMNTLGNMGGKGIFGWIFLLVVFCVGQVFNFAISILGAFVHSCRLMFVEIFGRFYEGGGRDFDPMFYKTKYVEIKEK